MHGATIIIKKTQLLFFRVQCKSGAPLYVFLGGWRGGVLDEKYGLWFLTVSGDKNSDNECEVLDLVSPV